MLEIKGRLGRLRHGDIELEVALDAGPRITGFRTGGSDLFVRLPDVGIDLADGRRLSLLGGHRLWLAPEDPEVTYEPDDDPIDLEEIPNGLRMRDRARAVRKEITAVIDGSRVVVTHRLRNFGQAPVSVAPWAVTQLEPGGTALLPLTTDAADDHGLQATAAVMAWSYTDLGDPGLRFGDDLVAVSGTRSTPLKVGTRLDRGWLAYRLGGDVFIKRTNGAPTAVDLGASGQVYVNDRFVELETVGPLLTLAAGGTVEHIEIWQMYRIEGDPAPSALVGLLHLDG